MVLQSWFGDAISAVGWPVDRASADRGQKQKLYEELNVRAYYQPGDDHVEVSAMPQVGKGRVGGAMHRLTHLRARLPLARAA